MRTLKHRKASSSDLDRNGVRMYAHLRHAANNASDQAKEDTKPETAYITLLATLLRDTMSIGSPLSAGVYKTVAEPVGPGYEAFGLPRSKGSVDKTVLAKVRIYMSKLKSRAAISINEGEDLLPYSRRQGRGSCICALRPCEFGQKSARNL